MKEITTIMPISTKMASLQQINSHRKDIEHNINFIIHKEKMRQHKKQKKDHTIFEYTTKQILHNSSMHHKLNGSKTSRYSKMPELKNKSNLRLRTTSSDIIPSKNSKPYFSKYTINIVSEYRVPECLIPCENPIAKAKWRVYRCQLSTAEESCCCSCNSDAMFEVMKSLYDCYKKKNCDHCNCILCGHLPREERKLGEMRKSGEIAVSETKSKAAAKKRKKEKEEVPGMITPLQGKTTAEKEKKLLQQAEMGIALPEGKTTSEKALIEKVKTKVASKKLPPMKVTSEKLRQAKTEGLLTPLQGKSPEQKEKILRGLALKGLPLPEGKTSSEDKLIQKVRADLGLPPMPKNAKERENYQKAQNLGLITPLEGKSPAEKEKILKKQIEMGIPLPEGRTPSEKALINKLKATTKPVSSKVISKGTLARIPSAKIRKAKEAGLLTPLQGKTPEKKEEIIKGLLKQGLPLPEGKTASEKKLIQKIRAETGLPPEPKATSLKEKYAKAQAAGIMTPLEGKSDAQKEKILKAQAAAGIPLPEGRTPSEKALIKKIKTSTPALSTGIPSSKLRKAKEAGLLTPLQGKTPDKKEEILKGLVKKDIPLPEGKTASEKKMIDKVRADMGLPPEPKTPSLKEKYAKAQKAGIMTPLEGKSDAQKEKILKAQAEAGIPLPEGRTPSEKALINKIKTSTPALSTGIPSAKLRKAKEAGLLTPLQGKTPEKKEEILKGLVKKDIPLPEGKTASEKKMIDKVRADMGLPPAPKAASLKEKYAKAQAAGIMTPLEGKSDAQKEKILKAQAEAGIPLPEGRTPSEKALITKIKKSTPALPTGIPSAKLQKAKEAGLLTPLQGKTPDKKEEILKGLVKKDIPLPEGKTASEKKMIDKVRADMGLPPEPKTPSLKEKYAKAQAAGIMTPLEGKSDAQKEKILKAQAEAGIPLPEGRTPSEKALINKIKTSTPALPTGIPSAKLQKAKEAGLLTPLQGKTPEKKEDILKGLLKQGLPLPEGKTASEKKMIDKVRADMGLPPEPKTPSLKEKYAKAQKAGIMTPLEGKSDAQKEKILKAQAEAGIPLPEGRTPSEKALINKIKTSTPALPTGIPSAKLRKAKEAGLLTPLQGKTPDKKEEILKGLVKKDIPLPEGKTASEKKMIDKVRADMGLPPEPKTPSLKEKYAKAQKAGIMTPLEGKSDAQKEKILKAQAEAGIPLPEGRTPSEKALINKIKTSTPALPTGIPSAKLQKAKEAGLLTPLQGKTPDKKEEILKGLVKNDIPLPEGKTASEKKMIDKVRAEMGLPPAPKAASLKEKYAKAQAAGIMTPLEGKSDAQKEKILKAQAEAGIPLPEGRTPSEKALINKIKTSTPALPTGIPSAKLQKAKEAGLLTPLQGKTPEKKEDILKGLLKQGLPLPEGKTASEKKLIDKVRADMGLPPEPKTPSLKEKYAKAQKAGIMTPLEGKSDAQKEKILKAQAEAGIPLPEGRTPSEKALVNKIKTSTPALPTGIPSAKLRKAKEAGLLTPLHGKTPEKKEEILKGLVKKDIPLPEGKTASEKKMIDKVRADMGLPPEPKTSSLKDKYAKAQAAGIMTPLEGKSDAQKEKILKAQAEAGIPLPEGRTPSEKALITKIKTSTPALPTGIPSKKLRKAKEAGLLTPLQGKTPEKKEDIFKGLLKQGLPLPEGKTASEKKLLDKVRADMGLPPEPKTPSLKEKYAKAQAAGVMTPLEGKSDAQKEKILKAQVAAGIPLPEGRTPSEKALINKIRTSTPALPTGISSAKLRKAKEAGLLTPLQGKTPEKKEDIFKGLLKQGLPLPEGKTASEKKLLDKVRADMGLPPEPKTPSLKEKYAKAQAAGVMTPLEGKSDAQKEKILKAQVAAGIPLPEGRTPSEKALINKIKTTASGVPTALPSEKLRIAKAAGLLTPLQGKPPEQKEEILKGLVKHDIPLPEGKTASEKKLIDKVRADMGLPPEPKTSSLKEKYAKAQAAGIMTPLEGKSNAQKEKILRAEAEAGIPLPEGRTPSEKALINKIKTTAPGLATGVPSEKIRKAKAAGLLTPLQGKTPEKKEDILKGLVKKNIPLPEGKTASEKKLIDKVRADMGLPPEPKTPSLKEKYAKAQEAGIMTPLEGKSAAQKEKILKAQAEAGIPLPEGRTPSEKALINKIKATAPGLPAGLPSGKLRQAKAAGLLTPLQGKTPDKKEEILKGLVKHGIPLPEGKTPSEKKLIDKVRAEVGLPPEPKTPSVREKYAKAQAAGVMTPLEGKSDAQKEKILRAQAEAGIPLPEGRTPSEKALINKIKTTAPGLATGVPSEKLRRAKAAGLLTPLQEKTPEKKEEILKGLVKNDIPLPEGKTASEKKLIDKVRAEMGLPPEPKAASLKEKYAKAQAAGIVTPLEGKSDAQKEKILKAQAAAGISLPEGRTPSEKALINKIKTSTPALPTGIPSEKIRKAKAAGLLTPIQGKTPEKKEDILKGLLKQGLPLPEGKTASEKKMIDKVRADMGLPPEPKTPSLKEKYAKAQKAGIMTPLEGKSDAQKEKILKAQAEAGIPLPEGRSPSEKALINKIKTTASAIPTGIPSAKLRKAKEAGLLTPLQGKAPEKKEEILKGLVKKDIPLPEGKTASEKKLIDKVRADMGLPPEPKTSSLKEKYAKAQAAGIMTPLEGKSDAQKEKILKAQAEAGIPLPEGRTPSEKALVNKIKTTTSALPTGLPSAKLRKAKEAGLLTPLQGKTPEKKEEILKGLVKNDIPLPEGKTASEKKLIDKVRTEMGLPPEPKTSSLKEKYAKAQAAGIMTPLAGKSAAQKEKILKAQAEAGIPLPEGRTPSEKALINKIKTSTPALPTGIPSAKLQKAKEAGLLTPLQGKTPEKKEDILKGLLKQGLPLPEGKTASEKKMIDKIRADMGLPPEPKTPSLKEKYAKAQKAGTMTPLEGKSDAQKEKILKAQAEAGIPLPEGRTPSEKALINKVKTSTPALPTGIPSAKLQKAKEAGLLTPLQGKTPDKKEEILKGLVKKDIPLPEGKTASEKKVIDKVRADMGLPPEPKTPSLKEKYAKAQAAGIMTPLEGKSDAQKEKILKAQADAGMPLPEGRTRSEKSLIAKVKAETTLKKPATLSAKMQKAKAAGLLTPLEGKSPAEREKILKNLAEAGLPLPEGKTPSDKAFIRKIKSEAKARTASEKSILRKAKAEGLLTPLTGKTPEQKEKILKGLIDAGLPLPEPKTASEKSIMKKVRAAAGLPLKPTPSEKLGKIKKRSRKIGEGVVSMGKGKEIAVGEAKSKGGILEKFEDIVKTTTCDRGCGCDKKKIRFKHSYVKIRVTSPDISSLCPCPNECLPGVKGGVFVDNEGIKVTVGSALGVPSLYMKNENETQSHTTPYIKENYSSTHMYTAKGNVSTSELNIKTNIVQLIYEKKTLKAKSDHTMYKKQIFDEFMPITRNTNSRISASSSASRYLVTCSEDFQIPFLDSLASINANFEASSESVDIKTESSLSFCSETIGSIGTISIISLHESSIMSGSSHYLCFPQSTISVIDDTESGTFTNGNDGSDVIWTSEMSESEHSMLNEDKATPECKRKAVANDITILRMSQLNIKNSEQVLNKQCLHGCNEPIVVINDFNSDDDIYQIIDKVVTRQEFINKSSIFLIVPTSDEYESSLSESVSSTICIRLSENYFNKSLTKDDFVSQRWPPQGLKITSKGKGIKHSKPIPPENETYLHDQKVIGTNKHSHCERQVDNSICRIKVNDMERHENELLDSENVQHKLYKAKQKHDADQKSDINGHRIKYHVKLDDQLLNEKKKHNRSCHFKPQLTETMYDRKEDDQFKRYSTEPVYERYRTEGTTDDLCNRQCYEPIYDKTIAIKESQPNGLFISTIFKKRREDKHSQVDLSDKTYRVFSMDTTEDRPCCCPSMKSHSQSSSSSENEIREANVASEIITPMIFRQGAALGLSKDTYLDIPNMKLSSPSSYKPPNVTTRISRCIVTPVSGYQQQGLASDVHVFVNQGVQSCCQPEDIDPCRLPHKEKHVYIDNNSVGCGAAEENHYNPMTKNYVKSSNGAPYSPEIPLSQIKPTGSCTSCRPAPPVDRCLCNGQNSVNCMCHGNMKKLKFSSKCPCDINMPPVPEYYPGSEPFQAPGYAHNCAPPGSPPVYSHHPMYEAPENYCQCTKCKDNEEADCKQKSSSRVSKRGRKNVICECPQAPEEPIDEEFPIYFPLELYERAARFISSDMTQTTSGFNIKFKKRPPVEKEMSFEDALALYDQLQRNIDEACDCDEKGGKKKRKKGVDCECPYEPLSVLQKNEAPVLGSASPEAEEQPLKGFKLSIGGKGSASEGLSGVCCFDRLKLK